MPVIFPKSIQNHLPIALARTTIRTAIIITIKE